MSNIKYYCGVVFNEIYYGDYMISNAILKYKNDDFCTYYYEYHDNNTRHGQFLKKINDVKNKTEDTVISDCIVVLPNQAKQYIYIWKHNVETFPKTIENERDIFMDILYEDIKVDSINEEEDNNMSSEIYNDNYKYVTHTCKINLSDKTIEFDNKKIYVSEEELKVEGHDWHIKELVIYSKKPQKSGDV